MSDIGINELIINKVQERLDLGQKKYGQDVPLKDNRDYHLLLEKESNPLQ